MVAWQAAVVSHHLFWDCPRYPLVIAFAMASLPALLSSQFFSQIGRLPWLDQY